MSSVCVLRPVFAFCVLRYVRRQNTRHSPKCLEMLGAGQENAIGRGQQAYGMLGVNGMLGAISFWVSMVSRNITNYIK